MATKEDILDSISALTVLELKELLDAFEERFGVTAAAPVAVAAAPGRWWHRCPCRGGEGRVRRHPHRRRRPEDPGHQGRARAPSLGLKEAKDLVDGPPSPSSRRPTRTPPRPPRPSSKTPAPPSRSSDFRCPTDVERALERPPPPAAIGPCAMRRGPGATSPRTPGRLSRAGGRSTSRGTRVHPRRVVVAGEAGDRGEDVGLEVPTDRVRLLVVVVGLAERLAVPAAAGDRLGAPARRRPATTDPPSRPCRSLRRWHRGTRSRRPRAARRTCRARRTRRRRTRSGSPRAGRRSRARRCRDRRSTGTRRPCGS